MKFIRSLCAGALAFFFVYLMGAFFSVSFDISQWEDSIRLAVAFLGGCLAFASFATATKL